MEQKFKRRQLILSIISLAILVATVVSIFNKNNNSLLPTSNSDPALKQLLDKEEPLIKTAIAERYSFLADRMKIKEIAIVQSEQFAAAIINVDSIDYRALLRKESEQWQIDGEPNIILVYADFDESLHDVIKTINDIEIK
jgi:hypothetical protein